MLKLYHVRDLSKALCIPPEVMEAVQGIVTVLDQEYGEERNPHHDDGGHVVILCTGDELSALHSIGLEAERLKPECTEIIQTSLNIEYLHSMVLLNNEYSIHIIMEKEKAPRSLLDY